MVIIWHKMKIFSHISSKCLIKITTSKILLKIFHNIIRRQLKKISKILPPFIIQCQIKSLMILLDLMRALEAIIIARTILLRKVRILLLKNKITINYLQMKACKVLLQILLLALETQFFSLFHVIKIHILNKLIQYNQRDSYLPMMKKLKTHKLQLMDKRIMNNY